MSDTFKRLLKILIAIGVAVTAIFWGQKIIKKFRKVEEIE